MSGTKQIAETTFNEVNRIGVFISETEANYSDSMKLLKDNLLRPLTYREALVIIDGNSGLKAQLKEKCFWLDGKGLEEEGYYTFDNEGRLIKEDDKKIVFSYSHELNLYHTFENGKLVEGDGGVERRVFVYPGNNPLSLDVLADLNTLFGGRFSLGADVDPHDPLPVVAGVPIAFKISTSKIEEVLRTTE